MSVKDQGVLPITDDRRTQTLLEQGVELVWHASDEIIDGEFYVRKIPSMRFTHIAGVFGPEHGYKPDMLERSDPG